MQASPQAEAAEFFGTTSAVNANAFGNGIITGTGTTFVGNVNVGDLLILASNNDARLQVKQIAIVINNTTLLLESNTSYFAYDKLLVSNASNIVISSASTSNLIANDIIKTNIGGNSQTSLVLAVSLGGNTITLNTVFSVNSANVQYQVWPKMNVVAYSVYNSR